MIQCKNCLFFERGNWHESLGGESQLSGKCELLLKILQRNNSSLFFIDQIIISDAFGCVLGNEICSSN